MGDLEETFAILRRYGLKLNPNKYIFNIRSGRFLGYLVTEQGIEVNTKKIQTLQEMKPPQNTWEVQRG